MFASIEAGARIEGAEARLTETLGGSVVAGGGVAGAFVERIAGGVACYAGPGSPMSKMIGVGFAGLPSAEQLAAVEARFTGPLQAEVSTLADPALGAALSQRGYVLQGFENVLGRAISAADREVRDGVEITAMTDAEAWLDAAVTGFLHPDGQGVPASELPPREIFERVLRPFASVDGFRRYCAWLDGGLAGVATLRIDDGVAQLCGAATLPAFRRRGVQAALLRRRLADGAREGCDLAVMTTQPGS